MAHRLILIGMAILAFSILGCDTPHLILDDVIDKQPQQTAPRCKVGDILTFGQRCADPNTDALFSVTLTGNGKYTSDTGLLFEATDVLDTTGSTLNGRAYNFKATKQQDGTWKIETLTH